MSQSALSIARLLSPVGVEEFFGVHWGRTPLHVSGREAAVYAPLLARGDVSRLVEEACVAAPSAIVETLGGAAEEGGAAAVRGVAGGAEVEAAWARGASFRVIGVQTFWPPATSLAGHCAQFFGCPVALNLYATPPGAQGTPRHYDNHDVLVLQIAGRKSWKLYEPLVRLPLKHVPPLPFEPRDETLKYARGGPRRGRADINDADTGLPLQEVALAPDDLLYLPRGYVHEVSTPADSESVHLTIGLHVLTWLDALTAALGQAAQSDPRFREALPPGLLDAASADGGDNDEWRACFAELLQTFSASASPRAARAELGGSLVRNWRAAEPAEQAATDDEATLAALTADARLVRRGGGLCRVAEGARAGLVGLQAARETLWMPEPFRAAFEFVARAHEFRPRDLPGATGDAGRLALARRLVQMGMYVVAGD